MQVQVIVHCAANTGFHVPLDEIMATNVGGWQQVLRLAGGCKNLQAGLETMPHWH
jgi:thioester reductase-like protein